MSSISLDIDAPLALSSRASDFAAPAFIASWSALYDTFLFNIGSVPMLYWPIPWARASDGSLTGTERCESLDWVDAETAGGAEMIELSPANGELSAESMFFIPSIDCGEPLLLLPSLPTVMRGEKKCWCSLHNSDGLKGR